MKNGNFRTWIEFQSTHSNDESYIITILLFFHTENYVFRFVNNTYFVCRSAEVFLRFNLDQAPPTKTWLDIWVQQFLLRSNVEIQNLNGLWIIKTSLFVQCCLKFKRFDLLSKNFYLVEKMKPFASTKAKERLLVAIKTCDSSVLTCGEIELLRKLEALFDHS